MSEESLTVQGSNVIPYRLTIAEIKNHFDELTKVFDLTIDDKTFIKLFEEEAQHNTERFMDVLYNRKIAIKEKASKSDPESVPFWWGDELHKPQNRPEVRGVPNIFLRSALFSIDKDDNKFLQGDIIPSANPYRMAYTGYRLRQFDLDLWQTIVHFARGRNFSEALTLTSDDIYSILNRRRNGKNDARIDQRLSVLASCELEIKDTNTEDVLFKGSLLQSYEKAKSKQSIIYKIVIGEAMRPLFRYDRYTQVNWQIREQLSGQFLGQWMHGYVSTHIEVFPLSLLYVKNLCGSTANEGWRFKETLIGALNELMGSYQKANMHFCFVLTTKLKKPALRQRQSDKVIRLPVPKQILKISHQPSDIQLISLFMRKQAKKIANAGKKATA